MKFCFKDIDGYEALDLNGNRFATVTNVVSDTESHDAHLVLEKEGDIKLPKFLKFLSPPMQKTIPVAKIRHVSHDHRAVRLDMARDELERQEFVLPRSFDALKLHKKLKSAEGTFEGASVLDAEGAPLGVLHDFIIDTDTGKRIGMTIAPAAEASPKTVYHVHSSNLKISRKPTTRIKIHLKKGQVAWRPKRQDSPEYHMQMIKGYIQSTIRQGHHPVHVRTALISSGWDASIVDPIIREHVQKV